MVEGGTLEKCYTLTGIKSSNLFSSASGIPSDPDWGRREF